MTTTNVHLEDVTRAARLGFGLAFASSFVALAGLLALGLAPAIAVTVTIGLLAFGCASGGFGLVARLSLRPRRLPRPAEIEAGAPVPPLRVPQPR